MVQAAFTPAAAPLRDEFLRDGFVCVRGLIERERALALAAEADEMTARRVPGVQLQWSRAGQPSLVKIPQVTSTRPSFANLAHDGRIVDVVEQLIGPGARLFRDVVVGKPAHTGGRLSPHQDSAYWDVEPRELVSAWVALTDAPVDRSPLEVVPRTHRRLLPHGLVLGDDFVVPAAIVRALRAGVSAAGTGDNPHMSGGNRWLWSLKAFLLTRATRSLPWMAALQDYRVLPSALEDLEPVSLPIEAGDVVFFHSLTVHGTQPNRTGATRYAHIVSYMPAGARCRSLGHEHFPPARP